MTPRRLALAATVTAAALLAGCAVGPDYVRPAVDADVPGSYVADTASARLDTTAADWDWWTAFGDTTLDRLVARSLRRNHDLQRATAAVLEARALVGGAEADRWPAIEVGGTATRSKANLARFGRPGSIYVNSFEAQATARYEVDLWGRLARAEEAARARLLASDMNRRVVAQTLVADVVRTWLELRELQCQLGLTLHTTDSFRSTLDLVEERYARGLVPAVEVRLARQNLLTALAAEPAQRQQLADAARRLEILIGDYPAGRAATGDDAAYRDLAMPPPLPPVPAGLPSELLERRPDLVAAEARLHAATADVGQAEARLFPTISLTGSAG